MAISCRAGNDKILTSSLGEGWFRSSRLGCLIPRGNLTLYWIGEREGSKVVVLKDINILPVTGDKPGTQIHEVLGVPLFADHTRVLTESFDSKLADVGKPLVRQLGKYADRGLTPSPDAKAKGGSGQQASRGYRRADQVD
jgi:hypothetical protein